MKIITKKDLGVSLADNTRMILDQMIKEDDGTVYIDLGDGVNFYISAEKCYFPLLATHKIKDVYEAKKATIVATWCFYWLIGCLKSLSIKIESSKFNPKSYM